MNPKLLIAGLLVFASLPVFAKSEMPTILVVTRQTLENIQPDRIRDLENAGVLKTEGDVIAINLESLNLIVSRHSENKVLNEYVPGLNRWMQTSPVIQPYGSFENL